MTRTKFPDLGTYKPDIELAALLSKAWSVPFAGHISSRGGTEAYPRLKTHMAPSCRLSEMLNGGATSTTVTEPSVD